LAAFSILSGFFGYTNILNWYLYNESISAIRQLLNIPVFIVWIYTLILWQRNDKNVLQFILLFFLIGIYSSFYFWKAVKKGWIR
jgi:hypothetical protein